MLLTGLPLTLAAAATPRSGPAADAPGPGGRVEARLTPGARSVPLTAARRASLLDAADEDSAGVGRELGPGSREKLIPKDVARNADGTRHLRYARTYAGLPVIGGDLVVARAGGFGVRVTVTNAAAERLGLPYTWTVLASGGDHFVNPDRYDIPNRRSVESPLIVTGRPGDAPADTRVTVDLVHDFIGGQVVELVAEDGTELMVKDFGWDTGTELHATFIVDASALPADGVRKLRVTDNTPGIFTVDPRRLDRWSLTF